jgi:hypothetical protein
LKLIQSITIHFGYDATDFLNILVLLTRPTTVALYVSMPVVFPSYIINPNFDIEKTACINKVLSLAAVGIVRSINDYDTAIVSCV